MRVPLLPTKEAVLHRWLTNRAELAVFQHLRMRAIPLAVLAHCLNLHSLSR